MTPRSERCGWVLRTQIVSREGFKLRVNREVLQHRLSQWRGSPQATVDNFVTAKASNFNKFQQTSTRRPQTIQHQSLRINKNL